MRRKAITAAAMLIALVIATGVALPDKPAAAAAQGKTETFIPASFSSAAENKTMRIQFSSYLKAKVTEAKKKLAPREIFAALYPGEDYDKTVAVLAKVLQGEARGVKSDTNKAAVVWCVLNRVDAGMRGDTVIECAVAANQFNYHRKARPSESLKAIAKDVLDRWLREKYGETDVGRVLPKDYCFFHGNGKYNVFRNRYKIKGSKKVVPVRSEYYED